MTIHEAGRQEQVNLVSILTAFGILGNITGAFVFLEDHAHSVGVYKKGILYSASTMLSLLRRETYLTRRAWENTIVYVKDVCGFAYATVHSHIIS